MLLINICLFVTYYANKIICDNYVVFLSNINFPKSKKGNGFWTFLKCPFWKTLGNLRKNVDKISFLIIMLLKIF